MAYEIKEVKEIRKSHDLTQTELAKMANVSQSLIAKIESGIIDPTYSKVQKIFAALDDVTKKKEVKASDIMNRKLISIEPSECVKDAILKMRRYEISQMPVISHNKLLGFISEKILLDSVISGKDQKIKEVMSEQPPVISINTGAPIISSLLKHFQMVLVSEDGELVGIITRSDLLRKLYKE